MDRRSAPDSDEGAYSVFSKRRMNGEFNTTVDINITKRLEAIYRRFEHAYRLSS